MWIVYLLCVVEIKAILDQADLMTVTKKQVRERLNHIFSLDLTPRKDFINTSIELVLQGRL
jgi:chitin synthase